METCKTENEIKWQIFRKKFSPSPWRDNSETTERRSSIGKRLQLIKTFSLPVLKHLCWSGAVRFYPCFCVQQMLDYANTYKEQSSKTSRTTRTHVPICFAQKGKGNKILPATLDTSLDQKVSWPHTKISNSQTYFLDDFETEVLL